MKLLRICDLKGIRDLAVAHKELPKAYEPGEFVYRTDQELSHAIHGGQDLKPINFVKPMATCAEAPTNTAEQPSNFYGTNVNTASTQASNSTPSPLTSIPQIISNSDMTTTNPALPLRPFPLVLLSVPLPPPPPPPTTPSTPPTTQIRPRRSGQEQLERRRRRRPNPFNSNQRTTITGQPLSRYRYISEDTRTDASGNDSSMETDSANSADSFNFDPDF